VVLTNVVVNGDLTLLVLIHSTTEQGRIFPPVTVNINAALPAGADVCDKEVSVGATSAVAGVERVKGKEPEVPIEFVTVTVVVPGKAISAAEM
jgi:hypothetical protein